MRMASFFTLIVFVGLSPGPAGAGFIYEFEQGDYTVAPGGMVDVRVFLQETATTQLRDEGLFSGAVKVSWDNAPVPSDPAGVFQDAHMVLNPAFNDLFFAFLERTSTSAAVYGQVVDNPADLLFPVQSAAPFQVLLGTFTFTAGLVGGEVTHLQATDFDPGLAETVTGQGQVLDGSIGAGMATITVAAAVPEPTGLLLALLGGVILCGYGWRRVRWPSAARSC